MLPIEFAIPLICALPTVSGASMCSCPLPKSPRAQVEAFAPRADAIFAGRVAQIRWKVAEIDSGHADSKMMFLLAVFVPTKSWKGDVADTVVVWTPDNVGACGFTFEEGEQYLVFATTRDATSLSSGLCTGTRTLAEAGPYLRVLGPGRAVGQDRAP